MSIANRLYDRPHGSNLSPVSEAVLYVDGRFPSAVVSLAYIGRLQIHNAIGACTVKLLSGDLPKGYTLGVDNTTHEVVLKWPAYQSGTVAIPNANFELGDDGSWDLGPGWSIMSGVTAPDPNDAGSSWQAQYANQGGNSLLIHRMAADVSPGQSITCSCDVQQGASSSASAGAAVRLRFTDDAGTIIQEFDGAAVMSGSNSEWHTSSLSANVPGGATKVHIGADAVRNRENKPLWVDNFQWNLTQEVLGTDEAHTIALSLRVTDTSGRAADWSGSIGVGPLTQAVYTGGGTTVSHDNFATTERSANYSIVYVVFALGRFVGVTSNKNGTQYAVYGSTDGLNYAEIGQIDTGSVKSIWYGMVSTPTSIVALDNWTGMYRSTDGGGTWVRTYTSVNTWADQSMYYAEGMIVAGGSGGVEARYSLDDGLTWKSVGVGITEAVQGLVYWSGKHVLGFPSAFLQHNPDTDTWSAFDFAHPRNFSTLRTLNQVGGTVYLSNFQSNPYLWATQDFVNFVEWQIPGNPLACVTGGPLGNVFVGSVSATYLMVDGNPVEQSSVGVAGGAVSKPYLFAT